MDWKETKNCIKLDIYRNMGTYSKSLERRLIHKSYSPVALLINYRYCHYYAQKHTNLFEKVRYAFCMYRFKKLQHQCGIEMHKRTKIGAGLRLPHKGSIVIHPAAVIGKNCEIMQGVTIGNNILKDRNKVAVIGDEVMICAGAKIIGEITVQNHVVIGANAVVNKDVETGVIVAGVPAKVVGKAGNEYLINLCKDED